MRSVYVWDIPTRLFHWLLVASITFQYISAEILDDAMQWHFYIGYCTLGLILFRIIWGFIGHYYSRFGTFVSSPKNAINYVKGSDKNLYLTHNPLGAWSVIAFLAVIATQAISGLFITDDIFLDGPYHSAVSSEFADIADFIHGNLFNVIWALIGIHIVAVIFYQRKGQRLVQSMLTGKKQAVEPGEVVSKYWWITFLSVAGVVAAAVYLLVAVLPPAPDFYDF